jgi:hypothetical protein
MPDIVGTWQFTCSFSDGAPGKSGMFHCTAAGSRPGPLRADPSNTDYWITAGGMRFPAKSLYFGGFDMQDEALRDFLRDRYFGSPYSFNINHANSLVFVPAGQPSSFSYQGTVYRFKVPNPQGQNVDLIGNGLFPYIYADSAPKFDGGSNVDFSRPSIEWWANAEKFVGKMESKNVVWFDHRSMIGFNWADPRSIVIPPALRKPVLRCWVARIGPFWNVIWNLAAVGGIPHAGRVGRLGELPQVDRSLETSCDHARDSHVAEQLVGGRANATID